MAAARRRGTFAAMTDQTYIRPVLVGIDGTSSGLEALSLGSALAVLTGAPLVLAAVYGFESMTATFGGSAWPPREDALKWLEQAEARLGDAIPWRSVTTEAATVSQGLIRLAEGEDAAVLVLGASRRGAVGRALAGMSVATVVHGAPCAVAVVPHGYRMQPPDKPVTFGVAVNDAPESREAVALAARLAQAPHAALRVLSAVQLLSPAHPLFAATGTSYSGWIRERREYAARVAREAAADLEDAEVQVLDGDPVHCLVEASSDLDLLVVGSRRYGPLRSTLLGSVSAPLVEHAHCPVLIVPRGVHVERRPGETAGIATHA
jgi:nucleotide-binding universal stress UspA family protein